MPLLWVNVPEQRACSPPFSFVFTRLHEAKLACSASGALKDFRNVRLTVEVQMCQTFCSLCLFVSCWRMKSDLLACSGSLLCVRARVCMCRWNYWILSESEHKGTSYCQVKAVEKKSVLGGAWKANSGLAEATLCHLCLLPGCTAAQSEFYCLTPASFMSSLLSFGSQPWLFLPRNVIGTRLYFGIINIWEDNWKASTLSFSDCISIFLRYIKENINAAAVWCLFGHVGVLLQL